MIGEGLAEAVARLFEASGSPAYGQALDRLTALAAPFDMSCIFGFSAHKPPEVIHDGYSDTVNRGALRSYLRGAYLLDPFFAACLTPGRDGLWRMRDLAPDAYYDGAFAWSQEVHPCISDKAGSLVEEIGFIIRLSEGVTATYSLMRNRGGTGFDGGEMARLVRLEPVIRASLCQHRALLAERPGLSQANPPPLPPPTPPVAAASDEVFSAAFSGLTPAQQAVTKLILRGHSNLSIAANLGITEGTAKLHRYNIYKRLEISCQAELFQRFIDFLAR